jgi:hypothetical protein
MDLLQTVFLLLLLVALSGVIVGFLPQLPLPLLQVGIGALAALPITGVRLAFDPQLFLLLFVSPLLFVDGWRVPKREFFRLRGPILTLALGLVLFTVIGAGYFVHGTIPAIPLSAAFALAAVLSPTDAVAVSAVSGRIQVPPRLMHVLEGEALLNDAWSVLCLPLVKQVNLVGILYLENSLAPRVFTLKRLAMLELLASQAAISLENAGLYADLQHENIVRKRAEEELRRSEGFLAQGERIGHTGSWGWHVDTGLVYWSKEHFRIFDYDPETTRPSHSLFMERIHPEDRSRSKRSSIGQSETRGILNTTIASCFRIDRQSS